MRVIGFLRGGDVVLCRRRGQSHAFDRRHLERQTWPGGDVDMEFGDIIPDCADEDVGRLSVRLDGPEELMMTHRVEEAQKAERREQASTELPIDAVSRMLDREHRDRQRDDRRSRWGR